MSGEKKRLLISACKVNDGKVSVLSDGDNEFTVMLNPTDYSYERSINYQTKISEGHIGVEGKYSSMNVSRVSISKLVIDGTGAVGDATDDVSTQVNKLRKIVYDYVGAEHQPNVVRLLWGDLVFYGRLTKLSTKYVMFKPDGTPLRAEISTDFDEFMSNEEEAKKRKNSSPDLSHSVEVKDGDTLPLLCYRIYKDTSYYLDVARINRLANPRQLKPGTRLLFPPLE